MMSLNEFWLKSEHWCLLWIRLQATYHKGRKVIFVNIALVYWREHLKNSNVIYVMLVSIFRNDWLVKTLIRNVCYDCFWRSSFRKWLIMVRNDYESDVLIGPNEDRYVHHRNGSFYLLIASLFLISFIIYLFKFICLFMLKIKSYFCIKLLHSNS